jgi:hypothetical protein
MKVTVYSTRSYDREFLDAANAGAHKLPYLVHHHLPNHRPCDS